MLGCVYATRSGKTSSTHVDVFAHDTKRANHQWSKCLNSGFPSIFSRLASTPVWKKWTFAFLRLMDVMNGKKFLSFQISFLVFFTLALFKKS